MRHGSLFSGIGGFDLTAEWMGWENVFHCEWNPFGQKILKHYWPNAELFTDITKSDFTKYANKIDILTGGFPCQPYSMAGKRLGKNDERHLWPEMCRAIREIAPRYVVGENVRGLTNWNGGLVFDEVCTELENLGYQVATFIIPAVAVNAPHKRERIWFVAYRNATDSDGIRLQQCKNTGEVGIGQTEVRGKRSQFTNASQTNGAIANATNTDSNGLNQCDSKYEIDSSKGGFDAFDDVNANAMYTNGNRLQRGVETNKFTLSRSQLTKSITSIQRNGFENFPTQPPICGGDDGLPSELDGITFPKWRAESIKAYGNAVVPQVVYEIFKAIQAYENL